MPSIFKSNPDENAGKMKGKDYKESLEGEVKSGAASKSTGPNNPQSETPMPKGDGRRSIGT